MSPKKVTLELRNSASSRLAWCMVSVGARLGLMWLKCVLGLYSVESGVAQVLPFQVP